MNLIQISKQLNKIYDKEKYLNYMYEPITGLNNYSNIARSVYFADFRDDFIEELSLYGFSPFSTKTSKEQRFDVKFNNVQLRGFNQGLFNYVKKINAKESDSSKSSETTSNINLNKMFKSNRISVNSSYTKLKDSSNVSSELYTIEKHKNRIKEKNEERNFNIKPIKKKGKIFNIYNMNKYLDMVGLYKNTYNKVSTKKKKKIFIKKPKIKIIGIDVSEGDYKKKKENKFTKMNFAIRRKSLSEEYSPYGIRQSILLDEQKIRNIKLMQMTALENNNKKENVNNHTFSQDISKLSLKEQVELLFFRKREENEKSKEDTLKFSKSEKKINKRNSILLKVINNPNSLFHKCRKIKDYYSWDADYH